MLYVYFRLVIWTKCIFISMIAILNTPLLMDTQTTSQCQPEHEHWLLVVEATSPVHLPPSHNVWTLLLLMYGMAVETSTSLFFCPTLTRFNNGTSRSETVTVQRHVIWHILLSFILALKDSCLGNSSSSSPSPTLPMFSVGQIIE